MANDLHGNKNGPAPSQSVSESECRKKQAKCNEKPALFRWSRYSPWPALSRIFSVSSLARCCGRSALPAAVACRSFHPINTRRWHSATFCWNSMPMVLDYPTHLHCKIQSIYISLTCKKMERSICLLPIILSLKDSSSFFYVSYVHPNPEEGILIFYLPHHFYKYSIKYIKKLESIC